jgi:hypothetical protein
VPVAAVVRLAGLGRLQKQVQVPGVDWQVVVVVG